MCLFPDRLLGLFRCFQVGIRHRRGFRQLHEQFRMLKHRSAAGVCTAGQRWRMVNVLTIAELRIDIGPVSDQQFRQRQRGFIVLQRSRPQPLGGFTSISSQLDNLLIRQNVAEFAEDVPSTAEIGVERERQRSPFCLARGGHKSRLPLQRLTVLLVEDRRHFTPPFRLVTKPQLPGSRVRDANEADAVFAAFQRVDPVGGLPVIATLHSWNTSRQQGFLGGRQLFGGGQRCCGRRSGSL